MTIADGAKIPETPQLRRNCHTVRKDKFSVIVPLVWTCSLTATVTQSRWQTVPYCEQ